MASVLTAAHFHDEAEAYKWVEARVWPEGPVCPHCGSFDRIGALKGKSTRIGVYKCYDCRKPFSVKVGTIFEASHVPMHLWLQAMFLLCSSKKGISTNQLHRTLGVTLKTAWFMSHRIREAMKDTNSGPLGGEGMTIEADDTFFGGKKPRNDVFVEGKGWVKRGGGAQAKLNVVALVERGGRVRSIQAESLTGNEIERILTENAKRNTALMTDEAKAYRPAGRLFASHETVNHGQKEYARGDASTNTIEGVFSVFKRGMKGTYQHCAEQHLHRYLAEFDFRYNNRIRLGVDDETRTERAVAAIVGKRLTYETTRAR